MLVDYIVNGYKVFNSSAEFSMNGNKKFKNKDFVFEKCNLEILKSAIIYGPNNTGKSSFIESIALLQEIINSERVNEKTLSGSDYNFFNDKKTVDYYIKFIYDDLLFEYYLSFEYSIGITKEKLLVDNVLIFDRNGSNSKFSIDLFEEYKDKLIVCFMPLEYKKYTDMVKEFFSKIYIFKPSDINIFIDDVYDYLNNCTESEMKQFNNIIKLADISLDKIKILKSDQIEEKSLKIFSNYAMNNKKVEYFTLFSDSDGTKRFMKYLTKILFCLKNGGIVIIDEIDNSLHTLITKSIINIFNNEDNQSAQLIATSHDLLLLDSKYLFRKDQIWFTFKDSKDVYFYCLNDFKSNKDDGIRNDLLKSYLKGMFGSLPHPDLEKAIFEKDTE